jgi:hypothetical protein
MHVLRARARERAQVFVIQNYYIMRKGKGFLGRKISLHILMTFFYAFCIKKRNKNHLAKLSFLLAS